MAGVVNAELRQYDQALQAFVIDLWVQHRRDEMGHLCE